MRDFPLFPDQASTFASQVDQLYFFLVALSLIFAGVLPFVILYLIVRYHRSQKVDRSNPVDSNLKLELTWTLIPLALVMLVFFWGAFLYVQMRTSPARTLDIYVIGKQWMWHVQHPNGKRENNELHVPIGQPVKLIMTSQDVIHSFYIPAFRVKQDVLPGRYTVMWFEATKPGEYHLFCAEYCGTEHSLMIGRVVALPLADYERWLATPGLVVLPDGTIDTGKPVVAPASSGDPMAAAGGQLFASLGCVSCHPAGGGVGPSLHGLFGTTRPLADGSTVAVDENYLRESILNPTAKVAAGYGPVMPSYDGQVSNDQLNQLVAYIKSLGDGQSTSAAPTSSSTTTTDGSSSGSSATNDGSVVRDLASSAGGQLFANLGCMSCHPAGGGVGPDLHGLYGMTRPLADGSTVAADEEY
uniref:cytochrome c oxidase subunit II n=1 Tax=uncultured Chloroflexus sp. TaxID=214040 RepID=UPI00263263E2